MRVLFVDDEPRVLAGIEAALVFDGPDVDATFASSGAEAIELLDTEPFDVLVTDMKMPGLSGADVLEAPRPPAESAGCRVGVELHVDHRIGALHQAVLEPGGDPEVLGLGRQRHDRQRIRRERLEAGVPGDRPQRGDDDRARPGQADRPGDRGVDADRAGCDRFW